MSHTSICPSCGSTFTRRWKSTCCSLACWIKIRPPHAPISPDIRFFKHVAIPEDRTQCWLWTGAVNIGGYGHFYIRTPQGARDQIPAHRMSYIIHTGPIPEGLFVCHRCDNPPCVNPAHLFLGTHQDNMTDQKNKGRHGYGERHPRSKLTNAQVREMRRLFAEGNSQTQIAQQFNLKIQRVYEIVRHKKWKEVK